MINRAPRLGDKVKCRITGFTGVVVTYAQHLAGCDRLYVEPAVDKDGKSGTGLWHDIDMLDILEADVVAPVQYQQRAPGGHDLPPSRARD